MKSGFVIVILQCEIRVYYYNDKSRFHICPFYSLLLPCTVKIVSSSYIIVRITDTPGLEAIHFFMVNPADHEIVQLLVKLNGEKYRPILLSYAQMLYSSC